MDNRRKFQRFPFSESVGYQRSQEMSLEGSLSEDISQYGLKLNVHEFIPLNSLLEVQIHLPGQSQVVNSLAKVVWVRESPKCIDAWQVGIELIENKSSLSELEHFTRLLRSKAY
jgi:hypothetical protein